jgi:hypothetical protein
LIVTGEQLESDQVSCCGNWQAEPRNDLGHLGCLSDFGFDSGAGEQQVDNDVFIADWARESDGRQPPGFVLFY